MIHSMTAYARKEIKGDWGTAVWEIRSVNQRYLETYIRMPEQLRGLEPVLRERFRNALQRGKVECNLRFEAAQAGAGQLHINEELAKLIIDSANWVMKEAGQGQLNPVDVLRWPGVMAAAEQDMDAVNSALMAGFDETLTDFIASRASEGNNLKALIEQRLDGISSEVVKVRGQMPHILKWQRQKLSDRLAEAKVELDQARLEQEMVLLAQKIDVAEELDRLEMHIGETRKIMKKGGACGRRLDFMMQEFNRESNTLGSKSINAEVTQSAVELKVLIEQMREQIQNIE
ncbi:YicC/YloC family endoribonuclease [Aeromonas simiae]|uniref:YicC/YloC family endoribonuclease n=1 Tax=Aeromonas simiae TaxID=218936 RepID=UPI00266DCD84|nr:YicC/YloC family endoribonuclease [Aeromonas simiae]MDO2949299.1 YicC family protein [Aeromonas simiae]MDO2952763.1 YicC family protein [Aeromonas simiae]MDO2956452.1 YicC family protein [Aeromonas simiae]